MNGKHEIELCKTCVKQKKRGACPLPLLLSKATTQNDSPASSSGEIKLIIRRDESGRHC